MKILSRGDQLQSSGAPIQFLLCGTTDGGSSHTRPLTVFHGFSRLVVYIIIIRNSVIQKQCYRLLRTVFQDLASPVMYVLITGEKTRGRKHQGVGVHAYMLTAHNNELLTTMMSLLGHNERIEREVSEASVFREIGEARGDSKPKEQTYQRFKD